MTIGKVGVLAAVVIAGASAGSAAERGRAERGSLIQGVPGLRGRVIHAVAEAEGRSLMALPPNVRGRVFYAVVPTLDPAMAPILARAVTGKGDQLAQAAPGVGRTANGIRGRFFAFVVRSDETPARGTEAATAGASSAARGRVQDAKRQR